MKTTIAVHIFAQVLLGIRASYILVGGGVSRFSQNMFVTLTKYVYNIDSFIKSHEQLTLANYNSRVKKGKFLVSTTIES